MYYKQENGDTKGNEARDQWLFCTLMREKMPYRLLCKDVQ